jgi:hypothetical protein
VRHCLPGVRRGIGALPDLQPPRLFKPMPLVISQKAERLQADRMQAWEPPCEDRPYLDSN